VTDGRLLLATADAAIEGVHFLRATTTPRLLGRRALAVNLSDIAGMGGVPRWALVSMGLPPATPLDFALEVADGLAEEADAYETVLVGGNLARSPERILLDVTLLGEVEPDLVLYRGGARAGERVLVTGTLGDSAGGLLALTDPALADFPGRDDLVRRHRLPTPRLAAGRRIALARAATAMLDLSDGLASDLGHVCAESGVGAIVDADRVPISGPLRELGRLTGRDPLDWALRGGEDYELLLTAPADRVPALVAAVGDVGVALTDIGEITAEKGLWRREPDGNRAPLGEGSWRHFC
jgi:thiamine-monophosphate kinase